MTPGRFHFVSQVGRVPSMTVPLDAQQEVRFQRLMEESIMIDLHQHPMVLPEDFSQYWEYLRSDRYVWGYEAVRAGGFTAVGTANVFRGMLHTNEMSFIRFSDLLEEVSMMIWDISQNDDVLRVSTADEIEAAKSQGKVGFFPTVEHLAIGNELNLVDVLYNAGIRLAGLTYSRKAFIGDGIFERNDGGLSDFGLEVVQRMNELGMVVDVSHASFRTAMDAIEASEAPVTFSHDGSYTLASHSFQARRLRKDEELLACARKGGVIGITAVPNRLSNDPEQSIECVLDHYDYMVNLVGIDHVAIGTDTSIGDSVGVGESVVGRPGPTPARYVDGLESPADGKNIIRGLIARGYSDEDVRKIAGGNALALFRRVMG